MRAKAAWGAVEPLSYDIGFRDFAPARFRFNVSHKPIRQTDRNLSHGSIVLHQCITPISATSISIIGVSRIVWEERSRCCGGVLRMRGRIRRAAALLPCAP